VPYISSNYKSNPKAPLGKWTCSPTSSFKPFSSVPTGDETRGIHLCGQCVSYVKKVAPSLPQTTLWKKGKQVKGNINIKVGTVIATFNASGKYKGHAAIYVSQNGTGITVYDQWVTGKPSAVGSRILRFGSVRDSNNGDKFYVVE
jgi:hypothetical protein